MDDLASDLKASDVADADRQQVERLTDVLDGMGEGFILLDPELRILEINAETLRMTGEARDAVVGRRLLDVWPSAESAPTWPAYRSALEDGRPRTVEYDTGQGTRVEVRIRPVRVGAAIFFRDVTEARRTETERDEAGALLRAFATAVPGVVYCKDRQGRMLVANQGTTDLIGKPPEAYLGRTDLEFLDDKEQAAAVMEADRRVMEAGRTEQLEEPVRLPDGTPAVWLSTKSPFRNAQGDVVGLIGSSIDITARKAAEAAREEAEERLHFALDAAGGIGAWDWDIKGDVVRASTKFAEMYGLDAERAASGLPITEYVEGIHPDDRPEVARLIEAALAAGGDFTAEYRILGRDEEVRWVVARGRAIRDGEGRPVRFPGVTFDITDRKRTEEALRDSEARYRTLFESVESGFCVVEVEIGGDRVDYRVVEANPAFYRQTGFPEAVLGRWLREAAPALEEHWYETYGQVVRTGEPARFEQGSDALGRWFDVYAFRVGQPGEGRVAILFNDITARRNAEERLRELNDTLAQRVEAAVAERDRTWNNARDLLLVLSDDGVFRAVNPAWTTILGWTADELVGRSYLDFIHPDDHPSSRGALATATEDALPVYENRYRHKDGDYRWISWVAAPEGKLIYASGRDVTAEKERQAELERAQEALRQAQKMEAVGQLTGGIAHDFNNMLAVVIGSLDLLGRQLGPDEARARRYVDSAVQGARRAALLTQRLLAFSRQQPLRPQATDVNRLVAGMSDLLRGSLGGDIRLETVLAGGLWRTNVDQNQLENVILNLAVNARDAMPEGGRLTIETQCARLDARYAATHLGVPAGQYVMVAVTDTGSGMPPEVVAKAFDPFFTTKEVGKGTGLGLSQVYGFIKQSGGHVKIYSEPGQGTTVKVYLPRFLEVGSQDPEGDDPVELAFGDGRETVLVVEDEAAVRAVTVEALATLGYRVLEADGAAAALRLLDAHPEIHLLLTDVVMPEVNGRKLADEASQRRPDLPILFTTGYTQNAVVHNGVLDLGVELITKPFTVEELGSKVREVLDAAGARSAD